MKDQFGNEMNNDTEVNNNEERDTVYQERDRAYQDRDTVNQDGDTAYQDGDTAYQDGDTIVQDRNTIVQDRDTVNLDRDTAYQDGDTVDQDREGLTDRERSNQDKALIGVFNTESEAINVIKQLKEIGYQEDDITVVAKDKDKIERIDDVTDVNTETQGDTGRVGFGAGIGGAIGGITAAIPALGIVAIPGIGPILAAGPIAVILGSALAGGVFGGLVGALSELGVKEEDAKEYEHHIKEGKLIIHVDNKDDLRDEVYRIYKQNNSI